MDPQFNFCTKHISNPLNLRVHIDKTYQADQNFPLIQTHVDFRKIIKKKREKKTIWPYPMDDEKV